MAELPELRPGDFDAFFEAVHGEGVRPFPWQRRLALRLAQGRDWPAVLDLPTGSGKTAALDVAVFQLALEAGSVRRAPLRIVYVVDRRTIVDQAYQRAKKLVLALEQAEQPVLVAMNARLASLGRDRRPLRAALLRGGIARSDEWAKSPDQPLVVVSTVDQVGSRLLFRGYGVSDSMKPVHAGLLGNDALYLLDEVHLSQPFRETLGAIGQRYRAWAENAIPSPFVVVEMSATPGEVESERFQLHAEDEEDPVLTLRLQARKPAKLRLSVGRSFVRDVADEIELLAERPGATGAIVVNRVAAARELRNLLEQRLKGCEVHLLTGRMRPLDRDRVEAGLFERIRAGRARVEGAEPVVVVATQCIEAGADFDFDYLVTECASLDALRQRFGRLDRLGLFREARGVIVARSETFEGDPVYGDAIGKTWSWLEQRAAERGGEIDFGIDGLKVPADAQSLGLLSPTSHAPVLLPSHLDAWVQTSPMPIPDPDPALFLHGPGRAQADVQVVWRADLTEQAMQAASEDEEVARRAVGLVQALPPASREALSVPYAAARRWLEGRSESPIADVEGGAEEAEANEQEAPRTRHAIAWRGESSTVVAPERVRPGDTLVVPSSYGGIAHGTWDPCASVPVTDVAEVAVFVQRGRPTLRLHPRVVADMLGDVAPPPVAAPPDDEELDDRAAVRSWLQGLDADGLQGPSRELILQLKRADRRTLRVERIPSVEADQPEHYLVSSRTRVLFDGSEITTEDDRSSFTGVEVPLSEHLRGVRHVAGAFAERLGLSAPLRRDVELAALWHDVGKADPRFQRLLHGGSEYRALVQAEPIAKSALPVGDWRARRRAQERSCYPSGARHELTSVALMEAAREDLAGRATDWELVLHLVGGHHGRCRPFAPWTPDPEPVDVNWTHEGVQVSAPSAHVLARLDSGVAERFWKLVRRYGWWGLAWLEAILRLGDHRRSEEEQRAGQGGEA